MADYHHVLRIECGSLRAQVTLNGCAVFEAWDPDGRVIEHRLDPWILEGPNRLEVHLSPPGEAPPRDDDGETGFVLVVHRVPDGGDPWDGSAFLRFEWSARELALTPGVWTLALAHVFCSRVALGSFDFRDARAPAAEDRFALETAVTQVHQAVRARDVRALSALLATKTTEVALGLEMPREQAAADLDEELAGRFAEEDFEVLPLPPLTFTTSAGGRLAHARTASGDPPIFGRAGGRAFGMSLTLAHRRGAWRVVR